VQINETLPQLQEGSGSRGNFLSIHGIQKMVIKRLARRRGLFCEFWRTDEVHDVHSGRKSNPKAVQKSQNASTAAGGFLEAQKFFTHSLQPRNAKGKAGVERRVMVGILPHR
jgi:hypothetical protein